eukprot:4610482-Pleurochrysis_carterae.AAC.1
MQGGRRDCTRRSGRCSVPHGWKVAISDESASPDGPADVPADGAASGAAAGGAASGVDVVVEDDASPVVARVAALRSQSSVSSSSMRLMRLFPYRWGGGFGRPRK